MRLRTGVPLAIGAAAVAAALAIAGVSLATRHHPPATPVAAAPSESPVPAVASQGSALPARPIPVYDHVVVVMEENHPYSGIVGNKQAPFFNTLAAEGALMTKSFAVTHPSEPNYMALFAGSTFGLSGDNCPVNEGNAANLGSELLAAGKTFTGYSEDLPSPGSTKCSSGAYARKHSPWVNFSNVPAADSVPLTNFPSADNYASLPTLSFVIPNLNDDMHDGSIQTADGWLNQHLSAYATWAQTHNSLLIVTWDEDDHSTHNQIPTIIVGQHVVAGRFNEQINHYNVLATLEQMYGLPKVGSSASAAPITDIWSS